MSRFFSLLLLTPLLALGCGRGETSTSAPNSASGAPDTSRGPQASASAAATPPPVPAEPQKPLNVVLLSIDAMRADMPWLGYPRPIAPYLTKLAEESVVYENAYSPSSYTAQSIVAWLSGRLASTLYRSGVFFTNYPKSNLFFPEVLAEKQIRTIGFFSHMYFGRGKGLDQGFDVWELVPGLTFDPQTCNHVTSDKMLVLGQKLLGDPKNTSQRFFAWGHFGDPHDVYIKHSEAPDFGNKNRDRYDSEIWYTDLHVGRLLDWLKTQPFGKQTAVIITGDHGEAFGEHGQYRHAFEVWENLVRVPLMIWYPGIKPARIKERRSLLDLGPTVLDFFELPPLPGSQGQSLLPEVQGQKPPESREPILLELTEDSNNPQRRAVIAGDYKLLVRGHDAAFLLFNLKNDPGEKEDLAKREPEKLAEMKELYRASFAKVPSIRPYGGNKLESGRIANGPIGPAQKP